MAKSILTNVTIKLKKKNNFVIIFCGKLSKQGNRNSFNSPADCMKACMPDSLPAAEEKGIDAANNAKDGKCLLPKQTGKCRAYVPSYYYDAGAEDCYFFVYGGCGVSDKDDSIQDKSVIEFFCFCFFGPMAG